MKTTWVLMRKELRLYYASPLAYFLSAFFLLVSGFFFVLILKSTQDIQLMRYVFSNTTVILLLLGPLLAMHLIAEERKQHTLPLLFSAPVYTGQIILGKYLAALILLGFLLLCTLHYPLFLVFLGNPPIAPIVSGYIGLFLMGSVFMGIGLLSSIWARNATVAAISAFGVSLLWWFLGLEPGENKVFKALSLHSHQESFSMGWISLADTTFYLSILAALLALSTLSLSLQRGRHRG